MNAEIRIWANISGAGELTEGIESSLLTNDELVSLDRDDCRMLPRDLYTIDFKNKAIVCSLHTTWNAPVCRDSQLSISVVIPRGYKVEKINTNFGDIKAALTQWAHETQKDIEAGIALSSLQFLLDKLAGDIKVVKEQNPFTYMNADLSSSNTGVVVYTHSDEVNQLLENVYRKEYVSFSTVFVVSKDNSASFISMKQIILSSIQEQKYKVYFPDYKSQQELCTISSEYEEINVTCRKPYQEDIILKGTIADNLDTWHIERDDNNFSYKIGLTFRPLTKTYNVIVNPSDKTSYVRLADNVTGILQNGTLTLKGEAINTKLNKETFKLGLPDSFIISDVIIDEHAFSITIQIEDSSLFAGEHIGLRRQNKQKPAIVEKGNVTFVWSRHLKVDEKHPICVFYNGDTSGSPIKKFSSMDKGDMMLDPTKDITVTLDGYEKISHTNSKEEQYVFLDFERTTKSKFLRVALPIIILGLLLLYIGYGLGRYIFTGQTPSPQPDTTIITSLRNDISQLNGDISCLKDSIAKLNQKISDLQPARDASSGGNGINNSGNANNQRKAAEAIAKLSDIGFTQNDLEAARAAGLKKANPSLFNACEQLLCFCTDVSGRRTSSDLLKNWVKGGWSDANGKFSDLPQNVQTSLTTFVNDADKYKKYTKLTKQYVSLKAMIDDINEE